MPLVRVADNTAHSQMDKIQGTVSTVAEGSLNAGVVLPPDSLPSVEAEVEYGGDNGNGGDETRLSGSPTQAKPPTPPGPAQHTRHLIL